MEFEEVKKKFENCVDLYVDFFCQKQRLFFDYWVADEKGGVAIFGDYCLAFDDIRTDLEHNAPKGMILEWYRDVLEFHQSGKTINYYSHIKGLRIKDLKN